MNGEGTNAAASCRDLARGSRAASALAGQALGASALAASITSPRRVALALVVALTAGCAADRPWYDTSEDPDLSYLPLGAIAYDQDALSWTDGDHTITADAYLPRTDHAPVVVMLPGAKVVKERYRWFGATLASNGVATLIVQPDTAFGATRHTLGALAAAAARADWATRIDLSRVVLAGHSAGGVAQVGLTDVAACGAGFCSPGDATPASLRGLILLGYHNQLDDDDHTPMAAAEVPWLLIAGSRDGLATPARVATTVSRLDDRPIHAIEIEGGNHYQLTDYVDPVADLRLADDLEPTIGNREMRAAAATYVAAFARRYLEDDASVPADLGAGADERVKAVTEQPRMPPLPDPGLPRVLSERVKLDGLTDGTDAASHADVVASAAYDGARFLLVRDDVRGARVFRLDATGAATVVPFPDGAVGGFAGNRYLNGLVGAMVVWKGELYVGVSSGVQGGVLHSTGAELWAWNGTRWRAVVARQADADPTLTLTAISGCAPDDGDPRATLRFANVAWAPGQWTGAVVDDVGSAAAGAWPRTWSVVDSGADTLVVQADDHANDPADRPEYTDCAGLAPGATLALRSGRDEAGFGEPWNKAIMAMAVFDDRLFVGTALNYEDGGEVFVSKDGVSFDLAVPRTLFGSHADGVPISTSVSSLYVSSVSGTPTLYAGATGTEAYGARVVAITAPDHGLAYRFVVDDAVDADDVGTDEAGFGGPNEWITSMADFGGKLWLATQSFSGFALVTTTDGVHFRHEVGGDAALGPGFGDDTQLTARLIVDGDTLWAIDVAFIQYAGEMAGKSGDVFRTRDGAHWQQVSAHALGTNAVQVSQLFRQGDRLLALTSSAALTAPILFRPLRAYALGEASSSAALAATHPEGP